MSRPSNPSITELRQFASKASYSVRVSMVSQAAKAQDVRALKVFKSLGFFDFEVIQDDQEELAAPLFSKREISIVSALASVIESAMAPTLPGSHEHVEMSCGRELRVADEFKEFFHGAVKELIASFDAYHGARNTKNINFSNASDPIDFFASAAVKDDAWVQTQSILAAAACAMDLPETLEMIVGKGAIPLQANLFPRIIGKDAAEAMRMCQPMAMTWRQMEQAGQTWQATDLLLTYAALAFNFGSVGCLDYLKRESPQSFQWCASFQTAIAYVNKEDPSNIGFRQVIHRASPLSLLVARVMSMPPASMARVVNDMAEQGVFAPCLQDDKDDKDASLHLYPFNQVKFLHYWMICALNVDQEQGWVQPLIELKAHTLDVKGCIKTAILQKDHDFVKRIESDMDWSMDANFVHPVCLALHCFSRIFDRENHENEVLELMEMLEKAGATATLLAHESPAQAGLLEAQAKAAPMLTPSALVMATRAGYARVVNKLLPLGFADSPGDLLKEAEGLLTQSVQSQGSAYRAGLSGTTNLLRSWIARREALQGLASLQPLQSLQSF